MIIFDNLKLALRYFPIKYSETEISNVNNALVLKVNDIQWCTLNSDLRELRQFFPEINLSYGNVVTTGLGFGMLQTALLLKKEVQSVTVYEQNYGVIELFKQICAQNNFDISRLNIIHDDANNMRNVDCDWLLMDHFELHTYWEKIDTVRHIASNNNAKNVWFWSIIACFENFAYFKRKKRTPETFDLFVDALKIKNLYRISKHPKYFEYFEKVLQENR